MSIFESLQRWFNIFRNLKINQRKIELLETNVKNLINANYVSTIESSASQRDFISQKEFKIFSQNGEDGILLYIFSRIGMQNHFVVEIGIGNGGECNARNLIENFGWRGCLIDGSQENVELAIKLYKDKCKKNLVTIKNEWITSENIEETLIHCKLPREIDLLSIDIDGNDYWVWKAIKYINPRAVVIEYNASFGPDRSVTVEYDPDFERFKKHSSGYYHGASLTALSKLGIQKGYSLVCCDSEGVNAFFIRDNIISNQELKLICLGPQESFYPLKKRMKKMNLNDQYKLIEHLKLETV